MSDFMTAEELGITEKQHEALVWTLDMLESGALKEYAEEIDGDDLEGNVFYMPDWIWRGDCGTAGCIGGWAGLHASGIKPDADGIYRISYEQRNLSVKAFEGVPSALDDLLYFPGTTCSDGTKRSMDHVKPRHAARALRNYLTDGEANWSSCFGRRARAGSRLMSFSRGRGWQRPAPTWF